MNKHITAKSIKLKTGKYLYDDDKINEKHKFVTSLRKLFLEYLRFSWDQLSQMINSLTEFLKVWEY